MVEALKDKIRQSDKPASWWADQIKHSNLDGATKEALLCWLYPPVDQSAMVVDGDIDDLTVG